MKGGRLKVVNETGYDDGEVEALVRFGLSEIDLTGQRIVAVVKYTRDRRGYSGFYYSLTRGIPTSLYNRYCGKRTYTHHLVLLRIGEPDGFPSRSLRKYPGVKQRLACDWREGLVCIAAHEGKHAEHDHDRAYRQKSGYRQAATLMLNDGREVVLRRAGPVRVGVERIEPKCEAWENYMLRRYRRRGLPKEPAFATFRPGELAIGRGDRGL